MESLIVALIRRLVAEVENFRLSELESSVHLEGASL